MTRLLVVLGLASIWMFAAGGAAAAGPDRLPFVPTDIVFDGEDVPLVCDFPVQWQNAVNHARTLVFPVKRNGDQVIRSVGDVRTVVTNLASGRSVTLGGGFREDIVIHSDGSITVIIDGAVLAGYAATDHPIGPSLWFFRGHLVDTVDSGFNLINDRFHGRQQNLCTALG